MPRHHLILATVGALGMWAVVAAFLALGAWCAWGAVSGRSARVLDGVLARLGLPRWDGGEWGARILLAVQGGFWTYVGVRGILHMGETTRALVMLAASPGSPG